jgi:spore maturation protein CgeB
MRGRLNIDYRGWLANVQVPWASGATGVALHIPRRQYTKRLHGAPTIRIFEALGSGACLVSLPWSDTEELFKAGSDYAVARSPGEMQNLLAWLCSDDAARRSVAERGRQTVLERHTCDHRANQLLEMLR